MPGTLKNRAILHFLNGDLKDGWRDYEARLLVPGKVPSPMKGSGEQRLAAWTGGSLKRTRLLVRSEQGIGDQILFASLLPELMARAAAEGGSVLLECEARWFLLFARSFAGVLVKPAILKTLSGKVVADYTWLNQVGGATAAITMGSLPRYLRPKLEAPPPRTLISSRTNKKRRTGKTSSVLHLPSAFVGVPASLGAIAIFNICSPGNVGRVHSRPAGQFGERSI